MAAPSDVKVYQTCMKLRGKPKLPLAADTSAGVGMSTPSASASAIVATEQVAGLGGQALEEEAATTDSATRRMHFFALPKPTHRIR